MRRPAYNRFALYLLGSIVVPSTIAVACSSNSSNSSGFGAASAGGASGKGGANAGTASGNPTSNGGGLVVPEGGLEDSGCNTIQCSPDHHQVLTCDGGVFASCDADAGLACDLAMQGCAPACQAASDNKQSVGCDFYATAMDANYSLGCFAAFIGNTWDTPVHITNVEFYKNSPITPLSQFVMIPSGTGSAVTYTPYDPNVGIAPGQVAIVFLSGGAWPPDPMNGNPVPCPQAVTRTAIPNGAVVQGTGQGQSFHITTDLPVVAYQINPYGGGQAAVTGASLLLPTSVWDTNYMAVTAGINLDGGPGTGLGNPSINIISQTDGTMVTIKPSVAIVGGGANPLPGGPAGTPLTFKLDQGQQAQFSQFDDLTGSVISATNPIGVMAGNACMQKPNGTCCCDHGEQMLPPVKSLGNEYVGVMWRPRTTGDASIWRVVGAIDGTTLSYPGGTPTSPAGTPSQYATPPTTIGAGQVVEFISSDPFVVQSQDTSHPFMLFAQMSGGEWTSLTPQTGYGDPDFVMGVAPAQFLDRYVFMTDITYPETNLVVVRSPDGSGNFQDVNLDCLGAALSGWQNIGKYQWTTLDLMRHDFMPQNGCSTGPHVMSSKGLFGLWVWGWGTPETNPTTAYVSYGYPGGMNVSPLNAIILPVTQ